jgi:hypothetical protein
MSGQPFAARRVHDRDDDDRAAFSGLRRGRQPRVARARRSSVLTAAVIVVGLWAPAAGDSHPEVLPARSTARGEICFDVPATMVDWRSTAAATLGDDTVAAPTARTLRDNYHEPGGVSAIEYSAVSPPRVMQRRWLLLHEGGSFVVTPSTLRGRIFYPVSGTFDVNRRRVDVSAPVPLVRGVARGPAARDGRELVRLRPVTHVVWRGSQPRAGVPHRRAAGTPTTASNAGFGCRSRPNSSG